MALLRPFEPAFEREQGCTDIAEVKLALLETNGQISIVAKD